MSKSRRVIAEFYALLLHADHSFLKMNKTLFRFHYEVAILTLDKAEQKFREVFGLAAYNGQVQDTPVQLRAPVGETGNTIYISQEFHERIRLERADSAYLLANGYLVYLKKRRAWSPDLSYAIDDRFLLPEMDAVRQFALRLENSLRLNRHGFIVFGDFFAYIPAENRIVRTGASPLLTTENISRYEFIEKDNYALKIWLGIEHKIADDIDLAIQSFLASFRVQNARLRYLQLLMTLEVCFNKCSGPSADAICRYASILLAHDKSEFLVLYDEVMDLWRLRNNIMQGRSAGEPIDNMGDKQLNIKANRLEELVRNVLKKLVKIKPRKRENLIEELKYKRLGH